MPNYDVDLSSVEQAQEMVAQKETNEVVESDDDEDDGVNKVVFWIIMGVLSVFTIGVPILVYFLVKKVKQNKQLQKQIDENATKTEEKPAETETKEAESEVTESEK